MRAASLNFGHYPVGRDSETIQALLEIEEATKNKPWFPKSILHEKHIKLLPSLEAKRLLTTNKKNVVLRRVAMALIAQEMAKNSWRAKNGKTDIDKEASFEIKESYIKEFPKLGKW